MIAIFPETLTFAEKGMIEHLAVSARRYFERNRSPRFDIDGLLQNMGIVFDITRIEALGALLAQDRNGRFTIAIVLGKHLDPLSENFLKAHLLGHYLLHVQPMIARGDLISSGYKEVVCPLQRYCVGGSDGGDGLAADLERTREEQCDRFAGALLIPKGMVTKAWTSLQDLEKVADFFGVTKKCLQRRLIDIGLVVRDPQGFFEAEKTMRQESKSKNPELVGPKQGDPMPPGGPSIRIPNSYGGQKAPRLRNGSEQSPPPPSSPPREVASAPRGMERVREIAKMLDKNRG